MTSKYFKNSNGYTLLITILIITLFSVVGLSLVTLTMSGTAKNSTRENNTQSLNLAEKGQDYLVNEINSALAEFTKAGKSKDDFIDELEKYNESNPTYKCTFDGNGNLISGLTVSTNNSTDDSIVCIKDVHNAYDEDGILNDLKRKLEIVSVGYVNGKRKQITTFVEIGADRIPEQLKYALTSKGNLHLNGAVQVTGDLRFNGSLTTFNKSHIINGSHYFVDSIKPSIKSTSKRSNPRIVVGNDSKFYSVKDNSNAQNLYNNIHNLNTSSLTLVERKNVKNLFDSTVFDKIPTVVITDTEIIEVKISENKSFYQFSKDDSATVLKSNSNSYDIPSGTYPSKQYLVYRCSSCYNNNNSPLDTSKTFVLKGTYEFDKLATSANLKIVGPTNKDSSPTKVTIKDTLYVEGDLTIEGNVELNGSIFVNGQLKIGEKKSGTETTTFLKVNALIYVNKESSSSSYEPVDIQYSTINSLPYKNEKNEDANGMLIIFSKGKVKLSNNSSWEDTPSEIYGYFYSEKELEIYGSGSNMKIHGGVYGNRITLHAIRGKSKSSSFNNSNPYNGWHFLKSDKQDDTSIKNSQELVGDPRCNYPTKDGKKKCYDNNSRLQVHYNEDVIATYIELNRIEELVFNVDPPNFVERE